MWLIWLKSIACNDTGCEGAWGQLYQFRLKVLHLAQYHVSKSFRQSSPLSSACPTHILTYANFPYPQHPLARMSPGLLCTAARTASLVIKVDLTSFGWRPLVFKLEEMVNGWFLTIISISCIFVQTFTRSSQSHLFSRPESSPAALFLTQKPFPSVYHHCCSSLMLFQEHL